MAGLPWIQVAVGTPDHPKLLALALELGVDRVQAVGHAVVLWTSIGRLAPHGGLSAPHADQVLERMAGWTGEPGRFAAAAVACGLVDRTETGLRIHDWDDHAGAFVEKFRRDAERQRKRRADAKRPADVHGTSIGRPSDVQREREREREIEKKPSPAAPAATAQKTAKAIEAQEPKPARAPRQPSAQEQIARRLDAARALAHPELTAWPCDSAAFVKQVNAQFAFGTAIRAAHDADPALFARAWEHYLADPYWRDHGGWPLGGFLSRDKWREHLDSVRAAPPASGGCKLYRPEIDGDLYPDPGEPNPLPFMPSRTGAAHG